MDEFVSHYRRDGDEFCLLVRAGFDVHAVLQEDVGGARNVLAAAEGVVT
jgi:hypothetical protein